MKQTIAGSKRLSARDTVLLGESFREIRRKKRELTAAAVVEAARSEKSPLHRFFEWNDGVAAEKHRLTQASELIRSVRVTIQSDPADVARSVRAYVSIVKKTGRSFEPIMDVLSRKSWREQMLADAHRELETFKKKYAELTELAAVFEAIDGVRKRRAG